MLIVFLCENSHDYTAALRGFNTTPVFNQFKLVYKLLLLVKTRVLFAVSRLWPITRIILFKGQTVKSL